ncbi:MAG: DNA topoisomerase [Mycoplasma sp.]
MKNLMIVESSGKIKTIEKILGVDWKVIATAGHFRGIDSKSHNHYGFNFTDFIPKWEVTKANVIKDINFHGNNVDNIYVAVDPDREGEAIAWHIYEVLTPANRLKAKRVVFNELTKTQLEKAINTPTQLDQRLVDAQFGRSVLDKLFGYKASGIVQSKIGAKSAGRVQSMSLRLIEEREREIEAFVEKKWYVLEPTLTNETKTVNKAKKVDGNFGENIKYETFTQAKSVVDTLSTDYIVDNISNPQIKLKKPPLPLTTAESLTLAARFGLDTKQASAVFKKFYDEGDFTYPRTDSIRIQPEVVEDIKKLIIDKYGNDYCFQTNQPVFNTMKQADSVQEGHDALRPTNINVTVEDIRAKYANDSSVTEKYFKVYDAVRTITIAACMSEMKFEETITSFLNNGHYFVGTAKTIVFDGYQKLYGEIEKEEKVESGEKLEDYSVNGGPLKVGDVLKCIRPNDIISEKKNSCPRRYTEPDLIKTLKIKEIGRPATISTMVQINIERGYVFKERKFLKPNELGRKVAKYIIDNLDLVVNEKYTKEMEKKLDDIANGKKHWVNDFMIPFYKDLEPIISKLSLEKSLKHNYIDEKCPKCNGDVFLQLTKNGKKMKKCSNGSWNPKTKKVEGCDFLEWVNEVDPKAPLCPKCNSTMILRSGKAKSTGKSYSFYGCSSYPKCDGLVNKK